jgi:hypothetical protein
MRTPQTAIAASPKFLAANGQVYARSVQVSLSLILTRREESAGWGPRAARTMTVKKVSRDLVVTGDAIDV